MIFGKTSRRSFLAASGCALTGSTLAGANDRISLGVIGVGGMGSAHLESLLNRRDTDNICVSAVCDLYRRRLAKAAALSGGEEYDDYRKILDRSDIDAVLIATPDHWHAKITLDALDAGKHVYVEKPMTHTIAEALKVRDAVRRTGRVLQVGPQRTANRHYWLANEMIRGGKLGTVTWAQAGWTHNFREGINEWYTVDESAGPHMTGDDHIDWDRWLGHEWGLAPKIPYNADHFFRFRKYFRYNGGVATDLLYHYLAPLLIAIAGKDGQYPRRVNACGGLYLDNDGRDVPDMFIATVDYPGGFTVNLVSTFTNFMPVPPRIFGSFGTIEFEDDLVNRTTKTTIAGNGDYVPEFRVANGGYDRMTLPADMPRDLEGNFFDAIRQGVDTFCNVELGCATTVAIAMAVESYRTNKTLLWDAATETVTPG